MTIYILKLLNKQGNHYEFLLVNKVEEISRVINLMPKDEYELKELTPYDNLQTAQDFIEMLLQEQKPDNLEFGKGEQK